MKSKELKITSTADRNIVPQVCLNCTQIKFFLLFPEIVSQFCPSCAPTGFASTVPQLCPNCAPSNFMPQPCPGCARELSILRPNCASTVPPLCLARLPNCLYKLMDLQFASCSRLVHSNRFELEYENTTTFIPRQVNIVCR